MANQKCSSKQVITAYIYSIERNKRDFFFGRGGGLQSRVKITEASLFFRSTPGITGGWVTLVTHWVTSRTTETMSCVHYEWKYTPLHRKIEN